jgi:TPR repeat protein
LPALEPSSVSAVPVTAASPGPHLPTLDIPEILARGDSYLLIGDITSARLFYERAADAGSGPGAMRLGATFDPNFLGRAGLVGTRGDQVKADTWYRRARTLGAVEAAREPKGRETK